MTVCMLLTAILNHCKKTIYNYPLVVLFGVEWQANRAGHLDLQFFFLCVYLKNILNVLLAHHKIRVGHSAECSAPEIETPH